MAAQSGLAALEDHLESPNEAVKRSGGIMGASLGGRMPTPPLVAIAVVSENDRTRLTKILRALNVDVVTHESVEALRGCMLRCEVDLVITDVTLPDGNWVEVLRLAVEASRCPGVLVHSRVVNDRLWSEVLWRGAYDMLVAPYSHEEGRSVIASALRTGSLVGHESNRGRARRLA